MCIKGLHQDSLSSFPGSADDFVNDQIIGDSNDYHTFCPFNRVYTLRGIIILEVTDLYTRNLTELETTHLFSAVIPEFRMLPDISSYMFVK